MKAFELIRDVDDSGVSGTGKVAEACVFSNGRCVVAWVGLEKTGVQSIVIYDSLEDAEKIHGHQGHTRFVEVVSDPVTMEDQFEAWENQVRKDWIMEQLTSERHARQQELAAIPEDPADT